MNTQSNPEALPPTSGLSTPLTLWLQWHDETGPVAESEVTHFHKKIFPRDIEYVVARAVRKALDGHPFSELLGENGLITATMRAANAINSTLSGKLVGFDSSKKTLTFVMDEMPSTGTLGEMCLIYLPNV